MPICDRIRARSTQSRREALRTVNLGVALPPLNLSVALERGNIFAEPSGGLVVRRALSRSRTSLRHAATSFQKMFRDVTAESRFGMPRFLSKLAWRSVVVRCRPSPPPTTQPAAMDDPFGHAHQHHEPRARVHTPVPSLLGQTAPYSDERYF